MGSASNSSNKEVMRLEREAVIPILKPRLVMTLASLIVSFDIFASPERYTPDRIRRFLKIPIADRTFYNPLSLDSSGSQNIEPIMSGSKRQIGRLNLSDIDLETSTKQDKSSVVTSNLQAPSSRTRAKKKKITEVVDVDAPSSFVEATEYGQKGLKHMIKFHEEQAEVLEKMKLIEAEKTKIIDRSASECFRLRNEYEALRERFKKREEEHSQEFKDYMSEMKRDATKVVLEARILMAEEAAAKGFDISIWKVEAWKKKVRDLSGTIPEKDDRKDTTMMDHIAEVANKIAEEATMDNEELEA